jgi:hypothetical protein
MQVTHQALLISPYKEVGGQFHDPAAFPLALFTHYTWGPVDPGNGLDAMEK